MECTDSVGGDDGERVSIRALDPPCLPSKRFSTFLMFIPVMVSTVSGKPAMMFPISVVSFDGPLPSPLTKIILPVFFNGAAIFSASEGSWFICFFV